MHIRPADGPDILRLQDIAVRAYEPYIERMGQEPAPMRPDFAGHIADDTVFVWDDGGVRAYAVIVIGEGEPLLENIAVDPKAQGEKLGSKLLNHVEMLLRQKGFGVVTLYTNVHMTENIAWYTRAGFERVFFRKEL